MSESLLYPSEAVCPWASCFTSQYFSFLIHGDKKNLHPPGLLCGLNDLVFVNCLEQRLAHNKHPVLYTK